MAIYLIETQQNSDSILKNLLIQLLRHQKETLIQYSQTDFFISKSSSIRRRKSLFYFDKYG
ncbi:hypothetical protein DAT1711_02940 [Enterococcus cecorum]